MSKAAISIAVFGVYILLNAVTLLFAPNLMLRTLGQPPTQEPWLRVFGAVLLIVGLYYIAAAREEATPFFRWTTWGRPILLAIFVIFVALRIVPPVLIVFGIIDVAGAIWTALALRGPSARVGFSPP
jgi:hypothetical protein